MHWVMRRVPLWRLTCRHALETPNHSPSIMHTKDGRWYISHGMGARDLKALVPLLSKYNMQADLQPPPPDADLKARHVPGSTATDEAKAHMIDVVQRCHGAKRRRPVCSGPPFANPMRTPKTRTGSNANPSPTSTTPNTTARSATPPANGSPPKQAGKPAVAPRCSVRTPEQSYPKAQPFPPSPKTTTQSNPLCTTNHSRCKA
jgi:hypothetical protein